MLEARSIRHPPAEPPTMPIGTLPRRVAHLACGDVTYLRHGEGPPLLLVHGIPTSARLWEPLLGALGEHFDCIVPDLLGLGESIPARGADLASPGQAEMFIQLLDDLGVERTSLVLHDQGGAHGQTLMARHGHRVSAVAFVDVVCLDNWPVPVVRWLMALTRRPRALSLLARTRVLQTVMRHVYPLPQTTLRGLPRELVDDWLAPLDDGGRRLMDWSRYVGAQSERWTSEALPALRAWDEPAHVIWAAGDRHLPIHWAPRLVSEIPGCTGPTVIPHAAHFLQPEVPETLARELLAFFGRATGGAAPTPADTATAAPNATG